MAVEKTEFLKKLSLESLQGLADWAASNCKAREYEKNIFEESLDETNEYIAEFSARENNISLRLKDFETNKGKLESGMAQSELSLKNLEKRHDALHKIPESQWSGDDRKFMQSYAFEKHEIEVKIAEYEAELRQISSLVDKTEAELDACKRKENMIITHREHNVKMQLEDKTDEYEVAYEEWQNIVEMIEEKQKFV